MRDIIITEPHKNDKLLHGDLNSELLEKNFTRRSNVSFRQNQSHQILRPINHHFLYCSSCQQVDDKLTHKHTNHSAKGNFIVVTIGP